MKSTNKHGNIFFTKTTNVVIKKTTVYNHNNFVSRSNFMVMFTTGSTTIYPQKNSYYLNYVTVKREQGKHGSDPQSETAFTITRLWISVAVTPVLFLL